MKQQALSRTGSGGGHLGRYAARGQDRSGRYLCRSGGGYAAQRSWSWPGFIIDPSGIAVTNNHVVTGGGLYKVYVDGEERTRNAKVLGVSECAIWP
ncbi:MAG: hypothetical protein R2867_12055 [Caldilineaceae bacterium]